MAIVVALRSNAIFAERNSFSLSLSLSLFSSLCHTFWLFVSEFHVSIVFSVHCFQVHFIHSAHSCIVDDMLRYGMAAAAVLLLVISTCMLSLTYLIQTKQFTHRKTHTPAPIQYYRWSADKMQRFYFLYFQTTKRPKKTFPHWEMALTIRFMCAFAFSVFLSDFHFVLVHSLLLLVLRLFHIPHPVLLIVCSTIFITCSQSQPIQ